LPASRLFIHLHCLAPQNYAITSQKQWAAACSVGYNDPYLHIGSQQGASSTVFAACAAILFVGIFALAKYIKRSRARKQYIHLADDEVSSRELQTRDND
jgi:lysosomal acid phosphatase